ncbi:MAG: dihydroneopterin aldolase [Patescibacteria group bacterium]
MDKIFISDLAVRGKHGVTEVERSREQGFILDIEIRFDTKKAAASDALGDTVDYGSFRAAAKDVVEGPSFKLLETLAGAVAERILQDTRIRSIAVSVRKTEMYPDCTPGVTIERTR